MKIAARAPVRIDPAGGGTDAPPYSTEYGGCVVNMSVARYSYAQLQWLANVFRNNKPSAAAAA